MSTLVSILAADINRHHAMASAKADEAVNHAVEAGKLLLQAKGAMRHGQFVTWLASNVTVTPRQAQRYMAAAQGKPTPIRAPAKATRVSLLTGQQAGSRPSPGVTEAAFVPDTVQKWLSQPVFCPAPGHWHTAVGDAGAYWVVPSLEYPACFHISRFTPEDANGESDFDGTRQPVAGFMVETYLETVFGLPDPLKLEWTSIQREGLSRPFGEPEVQAAIAGA